jgi:alginate O-acetyltransferase complex protein AlgI
VIFTDLRFLALFLSCWLCFFALPRAWRMGVLAFWGLAFYLTYAPRFLPVVLALTLLVLGARRRALAWVAGALLLAALAAAKLLLPGGPMPLPGGGGTEGVLVPLGLSYLTFELLHVLIERRRGRLGPIGATDLLAFAFFAPARVAGPIKRLPEFVAAVGAAVPSASNVYAGLLRILAGLAKKLLLADVLALSVAESPYAASARHAWLIVLAFALQVYLDFSAYSDLAIGFSRTLGIALPENFRWPYLARNLRDFWDRWHISLSHWMRDYLFLPMGSALFRTRLRARPAAIATLCYLTTFLVIGAWHGLSAGYLVWGLYHGALLSLLHVVRLRSPAALVAHPWYRSRAAGAFATALTFLCVTVGWVPFMLPWPGALRLLALMFGSGP